MKLLLTTIFCQRLSWKAAGHEDVEKAGRVKRIASSLKSTEVLLHMHFLDFILGPLNTFNTLFQSEESKVVVLHDEMAHLMQSMLTKFVKACIIMDCRRLVDVPFENQENQVENNDIEIGTKAREVIDQCQSTHASDIESEDPLEQEQQLSLDPAIEARFFRSVRLFYITCKQDATKVSFH